MGIEIVVAILVPIATGIFSLFIYEIHKLRNSVDGIRSLFTPIVIDVALQKQTLEDHQRRLTTIENFVLPAKLK